MPRSYKSMFEFSNEFFKMFPPEYEELFDELGMDSVSESVDGINESIYKDILTGVSKLIPLDFLTGLTQNTVNNNTSRRNDRSRNPVMADRRRPEIVDVPLPTGLLYYFKYKLEPAPRKLLEFKLKPLKFKTNSDG